jgi:hypothetical protein
MSARSRGSKIKRAPSRSTLIGKRHGLFAPQPGFFGVGAVDRPIGLVDDCLGHRRNIVTATSVAWPGAQPVTPYSVASSPTRLHRIEMLWES